MSRRSSSRRCRSSLRACFALVASWVCTSVWADVAVTIRGVPDEIRDNVLVFLSLERYKKSDDLSAETIERLQNRIDREVRAAIKPFGYYDPTVKSTVTRGPSSSERDWRVTIDVEPGTPIVVNAVDVKITGPGGVDEKLTRIVASPPIKPGDQLSHAAYE